MSLTLAPGDEGHPRRRATLRDVAALAGVSVATASKTLSGKYRVSGEARQRVELAAQELQFSPNLLAQGLQSLRTGTVGMLTSDLVGRFSIPIMMGAEDAFGIGAVSVFLCDARGDALREQHHLKALLSRRIDGLIVVGHTTNPRPGLGDAVPVPVVYAYAPSDDPRDISVISDNVAAGRAAVEHLLSCNRRNIAYIAGDPSINASTERIQGAAAALAEHGLALLGGRELFGDWSEEWGRTATRALLGAHPDLDAVLCGNDIIARGVLDAVRELGRGVPDNISVVGHDNWDIVATQSRPQLTTIDMNLEGLGRCAAKLLFDAIDGNAQPGIHTVGTRLVHRGSTAPK